MGYILKVEPRIPVNGVRKQENNTTLPHKVVVRIELTF